jgi:hypothetical protein
MDSRKYLIPIVLVLTATLHAKRPEHLSRELDNFRGLTGKQKIAVVFKERLYGRSFMFWRRSSEVWWTEADARLAFEEEVLVASPDREINDALADEIRSSDIERTRYAIFLACLRARFIDHSRYAVAQVNAAYSDGKRSGGISSFRPNIQNLGADASVALQNAVHDSRPKVRRTAALYTFTLGDELLNVPTGDQTARWRLALKSLPCYSYVPLNFSEREQTVFLLERALASRGIEAVTAISSLLKTERDAELRHREIEMLRFLDTAAIRLRRSPEGMEAIGVARRAWTQGLRYCGHQLYTEAGSSQRSWKLLEDQFLRDRFESGVGSWQTAIAVAMDEKYGDNLSVPFEKGYRIAGPRMQLLLTRLTEADPTFPAWEFPSTAGADDVLNPNFFSKILRYHEIWMRVDIP